MGMFSDYPHFYSLTKEGVDQTLLYAQRSSENGDFIISKTQNVFCLYGPNFVGVVKPNLLGTHFTVHDCGMDTALMKALPPGFYPAQKHVQTIEYDSNFFAEKPRAFRISLLQEGHGGIVLQTKFENLPPKYNHARGCYTLNFFGRVAKASARNFQLVLPLQEGEKRDADEEIYLSHGKQQPNWFNLDYRAPFSPLHAFAISLTAIGKKRVVG